MSWINAESAKLEIDIFTDFGSSFYRRKRSRKDEEAEKTELGRNSQSSHWQSSITLKWSQDRQKKSESLFLYPLCLFKAKTNTHTKGWSTVRDKGCTQDMSQFSFDNGKTCVKK